VGCEPRMVNGVSASLCDLQGSRVREDPLVRWHHPGAVFPLFLAIPDPGRDIDLGFLGVPGVRRDGVKWDNRWGFLSNRREAEGRGGGDPNRRDNLSTCCN
jgi:hypothetical protein